MADKYTAIPIGIYENVPVVVANVQIPTDFVLLEMPEDDKLSIIIGTTFLNTVGAIIDCTKSKVTFKVEGKEHTIYFPKKSTQGPPIIEVNLVNVQTLIVGTTKIPTTRKIAIGEKLPATHCISGALRAPAPCATPTYLPTAHNYTLCTTSICGHR
jgi:hypothetical protein